MTHDHRIALVPALLDYACGDGKGRPHLGDPVYDAVVEGRQRQTEQLRAAWEKRDPATRGPKPFYSSCGDLAHWLLYRLGVREPWLNRAEHRGWRPARNVTLLVCRAQYGTNALAEVATANDRYAPGDILVVNTATPATTHVVVVREHPDPDTLVVGEYGQPGGHIAAKTVTRPGKPRAALGKRQIDSVLRLRRVLEASALAAPESAEDFRVRLPGPALPSSGSTGLPTLRVGASGATVRRLQQALGVTDDGAFGPKTQAALVAAQQRLGIEADGVCGPRTWAALGVTA